MAEALALLIQHHNERETQTASSDQQTSPNPIGITNGVRLLLQAEADITIL